MDVHRIKCGFGAYRIASSDYGVDDDVSTVLSDSENEESDSKEDVERVRVPPIRSRRIAAPFTVGD